MDAGASPLAETRADPLLRLHVRQRNTDDRWGCAARRPPPRNDVGSSVPTSRSPVQVTEAHRPCGRSAAELEDVQTLRDLGLVDEVVVPVRRPGAAQVRRAERWRVRPPQRDRAGRVRELGDPGAGLVVPTHEDVPAAPQRHQVVVVDRAVLAGSVLASGQHPLTELGSGLRVVEEGALVHVRIGRLAFRSGAAARFPAGDDDLTVPREGRRVPAAVRGGVAHARLGDREQERRVPRVGDVEHVDRVRTGAGRLVHDAEDDPHVVAAFGEKRTTMPPVVLGRVLRSGKLARVRKVGGGVSSCPCRSSARTSAGHPTLSPVRARRILWADRPTVRPPARAASREK